MILDTIHPQQLQFASCIGENRRELVGSIRSATQTLFFAADTGSRWRRLVLRLIPLFEKVSCCSGVPASERDSK